MSDIRSRAGDDLPVMGLIFCSLAISVEASCHSLVMVLGGAGAEKKERDGMTHVSGFVPSCLVVPCREIIRQSVFRDAGQFSMLICPTCWTEVAARDASV